MQEYLEIAEAINADINKVLRSLLMGNHKFRTNDGYIKWGLVQKKINSICSRHCLNISWRIAVNTF